MPQFKVHVCRTSYQHLDIPVHVESKEQAYNRALTAAVDHEFPSPKGADYTIEGIKEVPS